MLHLVTKETFAFYCAEIERAYRRRNADAPVGSGPKLASAVIILMNDELVQARQFAENISLCMKRLNGRSDEPEPQLDDAQEIAAKRAS